MRSFLERLRHWWQRLVGAPEPDLGARPVEPSFGQTPRYDPRWPN